MLKKALGRQPLGLHLKHIHVGQYKFTPQLTISHKEESSVNAALGPMPSLKDAHSSGAQHL